MTALNNSFFKMAAFSRLKRGSHNHKRAQMICIHYTDNKGFDCYDKDLPTSFPEQVTVAEVDKVKMSDAFSKSSEQKHDDGTSDSFKKPSVVSCDLESALPAAVGPKTVRAWLKDPLLYKVIPLS